jgi:hypothetical protein
MQCWRVSVHTVMTVVILNSTCQFTHPLTKIEQAEPLVKDILTLKGRMSTFVTKIRMQKYW